MSFDTIHWLSSGLPSLCFDLLTGWVGNCKRSSVVEPTWLPSHRHESQSLRKWEARRYGWRKAGSKQGEKKSTDYARPRFEPVASWASNLLFVTRPILVVVKLPAAELANFLVSELQLGQLEGRPVGVLVVAVVRLPAQREVKQRVVTEMKFNECSQGWLI